METDLKCYLDLLEQALKDHMDVQFSHFREKHEHIDKRFEKMDSEVHMVKKHVELVQGLGKIILIFLSAGACVATVLRFAGTGH